MEQTRKQLIDLLAESKDQYISGQELSKRLNISRSAIWKHMNELKKQGYLIEGVTNKGYRIISTPNSLSLDSLQWGLNTEWLGHQLVYEPTVTSTQIVGHDMARDGAPHGSVVVAGEQTAGRGRMKRYWDSKEGYGLWFSSIFRPKNLAPKKATQFTLVAAVAIAEYLEGLGLDVKIKWPNDIFIKGLKLSGILTEMQAEHDSVEYIIVGIGLNVNHDIRDLHESVQHKATSLRIELGEEQNINDVFQGLLLHLERKYDTFISEGFKHIKSEWESKAYRMNEWLDVRTNTTWKAKLIGIHEDGAMVVKDKDDKQHVLYSAEILW
ncbi:biotin--[acetyl-CoA-carboxylase] ligase [Halalkalibacillus sediminis]|uniref:Bifunctional ligase/repressor BirA n=1 Tax=Halalkalibacillus sediminis TaxID=2018042 RepID=A0A2I0QXJ7_9BACI|nr:biotin--[acetyl-CoA-carboxylase] ligase [Halalkalibacillus sediminis]PKR78830.1 biotin--[acetyl-CoA-carboxylase] ligase [Halalkalibacillus sediminis]